ncbi:Allophanate hydrolase subunit 2 [Croceitalea dokdonensis DOKDO 023]|uniref:Allophanate hydrolase subunit 2 n=1 Tax=Croceitalea dokdonensis DOKDO 023 TaxID=1300341 RepID=A0A0P7AZ83_9FLAO|nr:biotin-dependent carboxyltransferase family protein [Croceitalea dokdonensis]KPM33574.1 Allophanate hydrolase subunit 2 [Croceitalea dokdonensis DOKDO 023]
MLKVLKSGFFTSVQDIGRYHYRHIGVPVSGVMDYKAYTKANFLLENTPDAAVLEMTMTGPTLLFELDTYIALAGANLSATLNNEPIENYQVYQIKAGDILSYGRLENGFRSYLAVKGGLQFDSVLGSKSQYIPLTKNNHLTDGMQISYAETKDFQPKIPKIKIDTYFEDLTVHVAKAPEYDLLTQNQKKQLFDASFTVAKENNRMAYQLKEAIDAHNLSMLTSATMPGTVQLTPAGKLIVLMKDGQTTGGYPRILQLTEEAIAILAQKKSGDSITFQLRN